MNASVSGIGIRQVSFWGVSPLSVLRLAVVVAGLVTAFVVAILIRLLYIQTALRALFAEYPEHRLSSRPHRTRLPSWRAAGNLKESPDGHP